MTAPSTVSDAATVLPHHEQSATMWSAGGADYDLVSFAISDALAHAAQRLAAQPGDSVLDIATGTGWSARNAARSGAQVTGVDIAAGLLAAAPALSAGTKPEIVFRQADAEALPFADASFDRAISTFGIMFAANQAQAAAELARVVKPGGRAVIAAWVPGGAVDEFFGVIAGHADMPPPEKSPMIWGEPDNVRSLLGDAFELEFETGTNHAYHEDVDDIWEWYSRGFGPIRMLMQSLPEDRLAALRADVNAYHRHYETPMGLTVEREYLIIRGTRKGG